MRCQSITQHTLIVKRVLSSSIRLYSGVQQCCDTYLFADGQGYSHTYISESLIIARIRVLVFRARMMTRVCACFLVVDIHCMYARAYYSLYILYYFTVIHTHIFCSMYSTIIQ